MVERSGDDVCGLYHAQENKEHRFLCLGLKTKVDGFSRFGLNTGGVGFLGLDLKTGSYSLVIWVPKSPLRFLDLGLKTKQTTICRLHHKTDGGQRRRGTRVEI
jgi:hypothetical protein